MKPLLRFEAVTCRRGGRLLFEGLDLALGPGEALRLTGANGSGKSSLLRLAAGLLRPVSGRIDADRLALADDNLALDRELPLRRALDFWGGSVDQGMATMGLDALADVPVRLLSAGQGRRAALARVIASGVPLWLLDEPANALDSASIELLDAAIRRHRTSGGAVVAASHLQLAGNWQALELGR